MCHRWTIIWLVPTLLRDRSTPLYIMDLSETINHARTARDVLENDDFLGYWIKRHGRGQKEFVRGEGGEQHEVGRLKLHARFNNAPFCHG